MTKPTLIYFAARGRAEPIRVILAEAGVDWDEQHTTVGPDFVALKASGKLPFEALPVWVEPDGFRLAQTMAIVNYLGRTHGLHGTSPREQALVEQTLVAIDTDVRPEARKIIVATPETRAAVREELVTKVLPRWLGFFDKLLGDKPFIAGDRLTVADISLWYFLESMADNKLAAALGTLPRLAALFEKVGARPNIAAYRKSPRRPAFTPFPV